MGCSTSSSLSDGKEMSEDEGKLSSSNRGAWITLLSPDGPARMRWAENKGQCPWQQCEVERTKDCCLYALCSCYSGISHSRPLVLLPSSPTALGLVTTWPFRLLCSNAIIMNRYAMLLSLFLWYSDQILSSERRQFHSSPSKLVCRPRVNVFAFFFMPVHIP